MSAIRFAMMPWLVIAVVDTAGQGIEAYNASQALSFRLVPMRALALTGPTHRVILDAVVDARGALLLIDGDTATIHQYDSAGAWQDSIGGFTFPFALARDLNGDVYVADRKSIVVWDPMRRHRKATLPHRLVHSMIRSLRVSPDGAIAVSCLEPFEQRAIHYRDASGRWRSFGESFAAGMDVDVRFEAAVAGGDLDFDRTGHIWYGQIMPYELQKYSPDGELAMRISRAGLDLRAAFVDSLAENYRVSPPGGPQSVVVLSDGNILVTVKGVVTAEVSRDDDTVFDLFSPAGQLLGTEL